MECIYEQDYVADINELRLTYPEYEHLSPAEALDDFVTRVDHYRPHYLPLSDTSDPTRSYIKLINGGARIIVSRVNGYLPTRIVFFLMNVNPEQHTIWLAQPAASQADNGLGAEGHLYSRALYRFLATRQTPAPIAVWTATRQRALATAQFFPDNVVSAQASLCEQEMGAVAGLSDDQIQQHHAAEHACFLANPYLHRYPRGESYRDLAVRLENIIMQLERERKHVLIIAHKSVLRCIYAYFVETREAEIPFVDLAYGEIVEISPRAYGAFEGRYEVATGRVVLEATLRPHIEPA